MSSAVVVGDDLVMARSAYFLAARTVVNREDPAGLLRFGAPEDEYDHEVEDLIKWREAVTADQVTVVFGVIPSDMAGRIADGTSPGSPEIRDSATKHGSTASSRDSGAAPSLQTPGP